MRKERMCFIVRSFLNPSFFPTAEVKEIFEELVNKIEPEDLSEKLTSFITYFRQVHIGNTNGDVSNTPTFSIEFWNVNESVLKGHPRTTNCVEGWHGS